MLNGHKEDAKQTEAAKIEVKKREADSPGRSGTQRRVADLSESLQAHLKDSATKVALIAGKKY